MSAIVHLSDELAARLAAEAARRGVGIEQTAIEILAAALDQPESADTGTARRRHLAFAAVGASGQTRGAAHADELLGGGFGRD